MLNSGLTPASICDNTLFNYTPTSATPTTTFNWSRALVTGISNTANAGTDNPMETLVNTTTAPINVTYIYGLQANGCVDTQSVMVSVNPLPILTSTLTPPAQCDSTLFHYIPASATAGVTYTWSRALTAGISNTATSGIDSVNEYLVNTSVNPVAVTYVDTLTINGCQNTQNVMVTVNPKPMLTSPLSLPQICDSTTITYVPASATTGTTFTWSRAAIAGNSAASGVDTISEMLVNTTTASVIVTYVDTLKANGCWNTQNIMVRVMPHPVLTSTLTPAGLCDSSVFNYTPLSATAGTQFTWVRPVVLGIGLAAGSGVGNPNEQLVNTTYDNQTVTYIYTLNDSGCTNTQNVKVVVHPTPVLSSNLSPSVCSGTQFFYSPASTTPAPVTYKWSRGRVAGLAPATDTGSGTTIVETFTDSLSTPIKTGYDITLTANGCSHHELLTVTVNPAPAAQQITTHPDGTSLCSMTMFQNFGAATMPPAGQTYTWSANNAEIYAEGQGHQYILVDFKNPGTATITLNTHLSGYGCTTANSISYSVGSSVSDMPQIIYFNGQFICLQNDMDSYQWGYDDAITYDSTLLPGEINPNYFNSNPDVTYKYYWVMTTHNGCMQKTYYNVPTGIVNINQVANAEMKVFPNPANNVLNVEINASATGNFKVDVVNLLGQKMQDAEVTDKKAALNVSALPAGTYLVVAYRDGIKVAAVRFVKN